MDDSLDLYDIAGDVFDKMVTFLFRRGTDLSSWHVPIDFVPSTLRLHQPVAGPDGLFAVLQTHIILNARHNPRGSPANYRVDGVLDLMSHMRGGRSSFSARSSTSTTV
jgi:hypothetical protein